MSTVLHLFSALILPEVMVDTDLAIVVCQLSSCMIKPNEDANFSQSVPILNPGAITF